jgi:hypothetical protein
MSWGIQRGEAFSSETVVMTIDESDIRRLYGAC